jgi:branched-chain amino acid transport system permease protein
MNAQLWLDLMIWTLIWAGVASAWNLLAGYAGQFSLGHSAFFGIGSYTVIILATKLGISAWIGLPAAALLAACAAGLIGCLTLRTRGPFFTLITIAAAEIVRLLAVYAKPLTNGAEGIIVELPESFANLIFYDKGPYLLLAFLYASAMLALCVQIRRSRFGYRLLAIREDEDAARSVGVPVFRMRLYATMLSAGATALGGGISALYVQFIDPDSVLSFLQSVEPALITIVGGLGSAFGPLFGAILVVPLAQMLRGWFGGSLAGLHGVLFGILLMVILLVIPEGLLSRLRRPWRKRDRKPERPNA